MIPNQQQHTPQHNHNTWERQDSNLRRHKASRFTVWRLKPLSHFPSYNTTTTTITHPQPHTPHTKTSPTIQTNTPSVQKHSLHTKTPLLYENTFFIQKHFLCTKTSLLYENTFFIQNHFLCTKTFLSQTNTVYTCVTHKNVELKTAMRMQDWKLAWGCWIENWRMLDSLPWCDVHMCDTQACIE